MGCTRALRGEFGACVLLFDAIDDVGYIFLDARLD
jgi:hypothetical protein